MDIHKTIKFTDEEYAQCFCFANNEKYDYAYYSRHRGQSNKETKIIQNMTGKLGEVVIYNVLKEKFTDLTPPDFNLYSSHKKSWKSDLFIPSKNTPVHSKAQNTDSEKKYGLSWIFQWKNQNGSGGRDKEIFSEPGKGIICFVLIDLEKKEGKIIHAVKKEMLLNNKLFDEPKLVQHRGFKKVIYASKLEEFIKKEKGKGKIR